MEKAKARCLEGRQSRGRLRPQKLRRAICLAAENRGFAASKLVWKVRYEDLQNWPGHPRPPLLVRDMMDRKGSGPGSASEAEGPAEGA